jgi:hypothetical protein
MQMFSGSHQIVHVERHLENDCIQPFRVHGVEVEHTAQNDQQPIASEPNEMTA